MITATIITFITLLSLDDIPLHTSDISNLNKLWDDASRKSIFECKSKIRKRRYNFVSIDKVVSSCSKRIFDRVIPNRTTFTDCNSPNVIYLITCKRCCLQHVRETAQKLSKMLNWHRTSFNQPSKYGFSRILSDRFQRGVFKNATCHILENL